MAETAPLVSVRCYIPNNVGKVLVVQRPHDASYDRNKWQFPGGKQDPNESRARTAAREANEETGLVVAVTGPEWQLQNRLIQDGDYAGRQLKEYIYLGSIIGGKLGIGTEQLLCAWQDPQELAQSPFVTASTRYGASLFQRQLVTM